MNIPWKHTNSSSDDDHVRLFTTEWADIDGGNLRATVAEVRLLTFQDCVKKNVKKRAKKVPPERP